MEGTPKWEVPNGRQTFGGGNWITKRKLILISDIKQLIVAT